MHDDTAGVADALLVARELAERGVPIFAAPPCPGAACPLEIRIKGRVIGYHSTGGVEFHYPPGWERTPPGTAGIEQWQPGWALAAVTGHAADVVDVDPRNGGGDTAAAMRSAGIWPRSYGTALTPSGGTHDWVAPLHIRKGSAGDGIDVQSGAGGDGHGFVFIAPTVRMSKVDGVRRPYVWAVRPALPEPEDMAADDSGAEIARRVHAAKPPRPRLPEAPSLAAPEVLSRVAQLAAELAAAHDGQGNPTAARVAFMVGQFVGAGQLGRDEALAMVASGLNAWTWRYPSDRMRMMETIERQLDYGAASPRRWESIEVGIVNPGLPSLPQFAWPMMAEAPAAGVALPTLDTEVDSLIAEMLRPSEMIAMPRPKPLVAGLLDLDTIAWLIAEPGSFKSFVSLDLAARIANGQPWQGRQVSRGGVVYVVAEGSTGMGMRMDAWQREYGPIDESVRMLPRPVQAADERAWGVLVQACKRLAPVFVVLDTQARVTVGFEENSSREMGIFIERAEWIRRETGACVLVIHHLGRNGTNARGSSAIDGAQSTELRIERRGKTLAAVIHQDKQKDSDDSEQIEISLHKVDMGTDPQTGRPLSSLVLDPVGMVAAATVADEISRREDTLSCAARVAQVLAEDFSTGLGGTKAEIRAVVMERFAMGKASFNRAWNECLDLDVMRPFEHKTANFRHVPVEQRAKPGAFREPLPEVPPEPARVAAADPSLPVIAN